MLLAYVLQKKKNKKKWLDKIELEQIKSNPIKRIFKTLKDFVKAKDFKINNFVKKLAAELVETLDRLYLRDLKTDLTNEKKFKREFDRIKKELEKLSLKEKIISLINQIKKLEKEGKKRELEKLKRDFSQISKKLKE